MNTPPEPAPPAPPPVLPTFADLVVDELHHARKLYPDPIHSSHEGYSIISEEIETFRDEVRRQPTAREPRTLLRELVQTAAMCRRTAEDLGYIPRAHAAAATDRQYSPGGPHA